MGNLQRTFTGFGKTIQLPTVNYDPKKIYNVDALNKFNKALLEGNTYTQASNQYITGMSKSTKNAAIEIAHYHDQCRKGLITEQMRDENIKSLTTNTNNLTLAQKAGIVAAKGFNVAMSFFTQVGIMLAITAIAKGISYLSQEIQKAKTSVEDLNSQADELRQTIQKLSENSKLASEFVQLSKGVNSLGENVSLTADEFDRYHEIVNQIAADLPERVIGYDEEGNAILNLKETVESLTAAYKENKIAAMQESYYDKENTKQRKNALKNAYNSLGNRYFNTDAQGYVVSKGITRIEQKDFLKKIKDYTKEKLLSSYDSFSMEETQLLFGLGITKEAIESNYDQIINTIDGQINKLESEIKSSSKAVKEILYQSLWVDVDFQTLSDQEQNALSVIVQNLSPEKLGELAEGGEQAVQQYVNQIIDTYSDTVHRNGAKIEQSKKELLGVDFSKLSISDAKAKIENYYQELANLFNGEIDIDTIKLLYPVDIDFDGKSIDELFAKSEALRQQISDIAFPIPSEGDAEAIDGVFDELNLKTEEEISIFSKLLTQYNDLTKAKKAYKNMTQEEKDALSEVHDTFTYTDYSDQIEKINKNVDTLDKALETLKKGESLDNSDIDNLVKLFPQYSTNILAASNDTKQLEAELARIRSGAAADFVETLRSLKGLSEEEQQAVDNLIKRYSEYSYKLDTATSASMSYADMVNEISDKESLLDSVHKEMNADGQISISTYQKLISAGQDYADLVEIENSVITVSEEKIKNLTKKKLEDEIATIQLALAEERYNSAMANRGLSVKTEREAELEADIAAKQELYDIWNNYTPSDSGGGSNNNEAKKQYSNELQLLKDALNDRKITYEQFLQQWQALNDKYHKMSEEEGGISDYEYNQNNRDIIEERKKAYEQEKKDLQELYEAGTISLSEYNARVDTALNHWLDGYAQLSDDFKDKTKENAEFAKTHFFDEIDRELEDLENKYDKTGDASFLNQRETTARNGLNQANAKLKGLYAQGLTDANEDVQFWLDKQKKYNSELQSILDERVNIVEDNLDKQLNAYDREIDNTGDTSIYYKEIDSIESARTELIDLIHQYGELGYTENSDKIKSLRKKYQDLGDEIVDVYDKIGDSITKSISEQIETVDREIKNGDISKYQVKLNILADGKKQVQELIDTLLELGYAENSTIVKSLKKQLVDYEDEIVDVTKDRADAQIDAFNEVMSEQKEQLDKYKDEQDEIFDAKIKALEDEKKALEKQNDEIEKQEKAQERIKDLLDAQRGVYKSLRMVYTGNGGWSIKATQESLDALKKVEEENEKAAREDKVDALDEQIDAIKEQKSAFDETVEKQIKAIDDDVDKFEDIMEKSYKVYSQLDSAFIESIMGKKEADKFSQRFADTAKEAGIELTETESTSEIQTKIRAIGNQRKASRQLIKTTETATEKLDAFADKMQEEFGVGNVDLTKRPFVSGDKMRKAGYDVDKDGTSTVYSSTHFVWQGDEEHGQYVAVHVTPILPNGEVLSERELEDYVYSQLEGSSDILKADSKGLVLKVDSDLNLSEKDIASLDNGKLTKHMKKVLDDIDQWDIDLHNVQEEWMNLYFAAYGKPNQKAKTRSINVFGEEKLDGFLGLVQQVAKGIIPLRDVGIGLSSEALAQLNGASNVAQNQTVNTNSFNPVITNNFTITTPNGNAEEIKSAVNEIVDTKIVAGFKAFYDGYYQQSMKEMYGH